MRRAAIIVGLSAALAMTGCVYSLHPYNAPIRETLQIQAPATERCAVAVDGGPSYPVGSNGCVSFEVPSLPRGCAVYLFGLVKVADHPSEDVPAIHVLQDRQEVRRLSLSQIAKLPLTPDGSHVLPLK
jgi:hypothetical protein